MNVTESTDARRLLHWLLGTGTIPNDMARDAAVRLADRSYRMLKCGLTGEQVRERWPATSPAEGRAELERLRGLLAGSQVELRSANAARGRAEQERDETLAKVERLRQASDAVTDPFARIGVIVDEWQENGGDPYDAMKAVAEQVGEP